MPQSPDSPKTPRAHEGRADRRPLHGVGPGMLVTLAAPGTAAIAFFFVLPIVFVTRDAFADGLAAFGRVFADPVFWRSLVGSAVLTLTAASFSLLVGFAVALHLSRLRPHVRSLLLFVIALPLTFSGLIVAFGFILTYGRAGFVTQMLAMVGVDPVTFSGILYSPFGLALASSYYLIPRVVMLLLPVLINFETLQITAAESLGATRRQAIVHILVPQIRPTAVTAFCLIAAVVFGATPLSTTEPVPVPPDPDAAAPGDAEGDAAPSGEPDKADKPVHLDKDWGVGEVTDPTVLRLKMDGNIDGITGSETATGFTIVVPGRKSISSAAGFKAKDKRLDTVNVVNYPDRAEITLLFKKDVPAFLARAEGKRLTIEIATTKKVADEKPSSKKRKKKKKK